MTLAPPLTQTYLTALPVKRDKNYRKWVKIDPVNAANYKQYTDIVNPIYMWYRALYELLGFHVIADLGNRLVSLVQPTPINRRDDAIRN